MKTDHSMPPQKVLRNALVLLERLVKILDHQSARFDDESVESFDAKSQKALESVSSRLAQASDACGRAKALIERVRHLLP